VGFKKIEGIGKEGLATVRGEYTFGLRCLENGAKVMEGSGLTTVGGTTLRCCRCERAMFYRNT
jgi:hypothetical protein